MELIDKDSIAKADKEILMKNVINDFRRMNQIITDISKFTRLKAEIELEKNEQSENLSSLFFEIIIAIFHQGSKKYH